MTNSNSLPLWIKWPKNKCSLYGNICHTTPIHPIKIKINNTKAVIIDKNNNTFFISPFFDNTWDVSFIHFPIKLNWPYQRTWSLDLGIMKITIYVEGFMEILIIHLVYITYCEYRNDFFPSTFSLNMSETLKTKL